MKSVIFLFRVLFASEFILLGSSMGLVALSLTLIFSSFCIFSGLHQDFYQKIELTRSHITLSPPTPYFIDSEPLIGKLDSIPNLEFVTSVFSQGLIQSKNQGLGVFLIGMNQKEICEKILLQDECELESDSLIVSTSLAEELGIIRGEDGKIIVADGTHYPVIFRDFFQDFGWSDQKYSAYLGLQSAQSWIYGEPSINRIEIRTDKPFEMGPLIQSLSEFDPKLRISTWKHLFAETLKLFEVERKLHFFFFGLLTIFVGVSVYLTFFLFFLRKEPSFKTILRLGYPERSFKTLVILILQFILITALALGGFFSLGIEQYLNVYPIELPQSLFYSATLPFNWDWYYFLLMVSLFFFSINFGCLQAMQRVGVR